MADNLSSRGAEARYPNGDPFAELSRIMGASPAAPAEHDEDALDFDLERELMGSVQPAPADRYEPAPRLDHAGAHDGYGGAVSVADPLDDEFADAFAAEFGNRADGNVPAGYEPAREDAAAWAPAHPQAQEGAVLAEVDLDFGDMDISDDIPAIEPAIEDDGFVEEAALPAARPSMEDELAAMLASEDGGDLHPPVDPFRYSRATAVQPAPHEGAWDEHAAEPEAERFAAWSGAPAADAPYAGEADTDVYAGSDAGYADTAAVYAETGAPYADAGEPYADDAYAAGEAASYDEPAGEQPAPAPDPFAVLAAMAPAATTFSAGRFSRPQAPAPTPAPVADAEDGFDTVPVAEAAVPFQDDFDLPDLPPVEDEPARVQAAFDDIDFGDFSDLGAPAQQPESPAQPGPAAADGYDEHIAGLYDDYNAPHADDALYAEYDDDQSRYEEEVPAAAQPYAGEQPARRRNGGMLVAAAVLGIAVVGGIGAFAFSFGDGESGSAPTLVRADDEPLKVRPENPGGTAVPNQDSEAYQRVARGEPAGQPQQERLVTTAEEPVRLAVPAEPENGLPGVDDEIEEIEAIDAPAAVATAKAEDRLETTIEEAGTGAEKDILAVQPRRVRTMVVRPDGTLVPREEAAPVVVASAPESALPPASSGGALTAPATQTAAPAAMPAPRAVETVRITPEAAQPPQPAPAPRAAPAAAAPAAPEPRTQVAQAAPAARPQPAAPAAPAAAAPGEWSMQIASQPSAEGAQSTYQDLARRYGSIIGGRGVNIVKADVPGKGTYYRVRIPSSTRAEAISLCERYKAAGGSCFVSK